MSADPYVDLFGVPLTTDNVRQILRECAANAPRAERDQRQAWGFNWAGRLLDESKGTPVHDRALEVLREMATSHDADEVWLAATFLPPGELAKSIAGPFGDPDIDEETRSALRGRLATLVAAGQFPWLEMFRREINKPGGDELLAGALLHDHAWTMQALPQLLGPDATEARMRLGGARPYLRRSEVNALREELIAKRDAWGHAWVDELVGALDYYLREDPLDPTPGVRWRSA